MTVAGLETSIHRAMLTPTQKGASVRTWTRPTLRYICSKGEGQTRKRQEENARRKRYKDLKTQPKGDRGERER